MTDHIASVVNDYRAAFTWTARCTCEWEELHSVAAAADRAVEEHMQRCMPPAATETPPPTSPTTGEGSE